MANGAWSNDQLNQILVYDPFTGTLILSVDDSGLYYLNVENGSYFKVTVSPFPVDNGAIAVLLQPGASSVPGVVYATPGYIIGGEFIDPDTPGLVAPELVLTSPMITGKKHAVVELFGQTNLSATDDTSIGFEAMYLVGNEGSEMGHGTLDEGGGYDSNSFTTTEIAADYSNQAYGFMSTARRYHMRWTGTMQCTSAGARIGLRIYHGPNQNNLTGATLIEDCGETTIAAANVAQPFHVETTFNGVTDPYILLGARRTSGTGTCFLTTTCRKDEDVVGAY